jgi:hypothetical protein
VKKLKKWRNFKMSENQSAIVAQEVKLQLPASAKRIDAAAMAEQMKGLNASMDTIKMPGSQGSAFEVPDGFGETNPMKSFRGVILYQGPNKSFWKDKYVPGQSKAPDCSSKDGDNGKEIDYETGEIVCERLCADCPMNQWGSAVNDAGEHTRGKACRDLRPMMILLEGSEEPMMFVAPPTSLTNIGDYISRLLRKAYMPWEVLTEFSLEKTTTKGGMEIKVVSMKRVGTLDAESFTTVEGLRKLYKTQWDKFAITSDNYFVNVEGDGLGQTAATSEDSPM